MRRCSGTAALAIALLFLAIHARAEVSLRRADAAYAGLRQYFYNGSFGFLKACGQTGGAGDASDQFNCACEAETGPHCTRCFRWWMATAVQTLIRLDRLPGGHPSHNDTVAMLQLVKEHAPYTARAYPAWAYMDDYLWYVHMWLDAYDWLGGAGKLEEARQTFEMVVSMASDEPCGGLVWLWPDTDPRKNSITVLEAIKAAARLALADVRGAASFRATALRLWGWFENVGLLGDDGLVLDHVTGSAHGQMYCCNATCANLGPQAQGSTVHGAVCKPRGTTTWTYNQGMLLGAAVELAELTGNATYLRVGASVLDAVVSKLVRAEPHSPLPLFCTARMHRCLCVLRSSAGLWLRRHSFLAYRHGFRTVA